MGAGEEGEDSPSDLISTQQASAKRNASDAEEIAMAFHDAINSQDVGALEALMTRDHRFIDSAGSAVEGRDACLAAWRGFIEMFSDYRNQVSEIHVDGGRVSMAGSSRCSDERLTGSALWVAVVDGDQLREWRVMEDDALCRKTMG